MDKRTRILHNALLKIYWNQDADLYTHKIAATALEDIKTATICGKIKHYIKGKLYDLWQYMETK